MLLLAVIVPFKVHRWDPNVLTSGVTIYADRYEALAHRLFAPRRDEARRCAVLPRGADDHRQRAQHSAERLRLFQIQRQNRWLLWRRAEPVDDQLYRHAAASESRDAR